MIYQNVYGKPAKAKKKRKDQERKKVARVYASELENRATPAEKVFERLLIENKINYKFQHPFKRRDTFAIVDFWLPDYGIIIEIDGGYHSTPEQARVDAIRSYDLLRKSQVKQVIRFTNEQAMGDPSSIIKTMAAQVVPWAAHLLK